MGKRFPLVYFDNQREGAFCKLCVKRSINDAQLLAFSEGVFINVPFSNCKKNSRKRR